MIDWFSLITNLATLATAVAALLTIREMRAQRRSTYRPEIAFQRTPLNLFWSNDEFLSAPLLCTSQQGKTSEGLDQVVFLEGRNVGLGAGTNLEANWHFDVNQAIYVLSKLDLQQNFKIWNDANGQIEFNNERKSPKLTVFRHAVLGHTPYMLPIQISSEPIQIILPSAYVQMFCIWVYLHIQQSENKVNDHPRNPEELPPLELLLSYSDIGGERYERRYTVRLELMLLLNEPNISKQAAWGQVLISEHV
jgi:hypothetical protein